MQYIVSGAVYMDLVVEAESPEEAHEIALNTALGTEGWEQTDYWICEPEEIEILEE